MSNSPNKKGATMSYDERLETRGGPAGYIQTMEALHQQNAQMLAVLRELVGDHCSGHVEPDPECERCAALALLGRGQQNAMPADGLCPDLLEPGWAVVSWMMANGEYTSITAATSDDGIGVVATWDRERLDPCGAWRLMGWGCTQDNCRDRGGGDMPPDTPPFGLFCEDCEDTGIQPYPTGCWRCGADKPCESECGGDGLGACKTCS